MIVLKVILFLGVAIVHCDPIHESDARTSPPLSLKWTSKFSMGLMLPDGREDEITLRHADTGGGVAVPCLFEGTLENDANGHVAVLGCRDGDNTQVTVVSKYSNSTMFNIIKNNKTEEIPNPYTATIKEEEEVIELDEEANLQGRPKRSTYPILPPDFDEYPLSHSGAVLDPVPADLVYGVEVAYDDTFLIKMGNNKEAAEQYILAVMAHAQAYLLHDTLGSRIHLHIRNKPKHLQGKSLKINDIENGKSPSMETAKQIRSQFALIIFIYSDNGDTWMGVANRRYGCDPDKARAILKWRCSVQKAAMTCAHEIAHLLGPYHDEQEDNTKKLGLDDCSGDGLMSDSVDIDDQKEQWSVCTQMRFARWYNNYGKSCTADRLIEGVACSADSNSWATPCLCGTSLCTGKHTCCEAATGTCLGFKNLDYVLAEMSWMKSQMLELTTKMGNHDNLLSQQSTEMKGMKGEIKELITKTDNHDILHTQQSTEIMGMKGEIKELIIKSDNHYILHTQQSTEMKGMKGEIKELVTKTDNHDILHTQQSTEMEGIKGEIKELTTKTKNYDVLQTQQSTEMKGIKGEIKELTTKTKNYDILHTQQSTEIKAMKGEIKELITKTDNHDILHTQQSTMMKGMKGEIKELTTKTKNYDILHTQQSTEMKGIKGKINELTTKTKNYDILHTQQSTKIKGMKGEIKELITKTDNHVILHTQQSTEMKGMKGEIKELVTKTKNYDILHTQQSTEMSGIKGEMKKLTKQVESLVELDDILHSQASACSGYTRLSDSWRHIDYVNRGKFPTHCDKTGSRSSYTNLAWGSWFRFTGAAGNKLPTAPAPVGGPPSSGKEICGTGAVAWIKGGNPTIQDGIVTRDVCFDWSGYSCLHMGKSTVGVAACRDIHGDYFVYQLQPAPSCTFAYCAID